MGCFGCAKSPDPQVLAYRQDVGNSMVVIWNVNDTAVLRTFG